MRFAPLLVLATLSPLAACGGGGDGGFAPSDAGADGSVQAAWPGATIVNGTIDARSCVDAGASRGGVAARCATPEPPLALAVCGDLAADNTVTLDRRSTPEGAVFAVGGRARTGAPLRVGGSFITMLGNEANNTQDIDDDLRTGGDWTSGSPAHIGRDAFVGGLFTPKNTVDIGGTLHVARMATPSVPDGVRAASVVTGPVTVASPLDCARAPDAGAVAAGSGPWFAVASDALVRVREPTTIILGCDRYRFASVEASNVLTFRVEGAVVIVVDGDLRIAAPTRFELAPGATLDLVVGGALTIDNTLSITGGRAWVGVGGAVRVASPTTIEGWLVAPRSHVDIDNTLDLSGAAFVGSLRVASPLHVRPGVAIAGSGCALD